MMDNHDSDSTDTKTVFIFLLVEEGSLKKTIRAFDTICNSKMSFFRIARCKGAFPKYIIRIRGVWIPPRHQSPDPPPPPSPLRHQAPDPLPRREYYII